MNEARRFTESSGNVFADLGLADPEALLAKARLAGRISDIIDERGLTQKEAAKVLGVDQPKVSMIVRGHLDRFSIDRLMQFLTRLNQEIEITVRPAEHGRYVINAPTVAAGD